MLYFSVNILVGVGMYTSTAAQQQSSAAAQRLTDIVRVTEYAINSYCKLILHPMTLMLNHFHIAIGILVHKICVSVSDSRVNIGKVASEISRRGQTDKNISNCFVDINNVYIYLHTRMHTNTAQSCYYYITHRYFYVMYLFVFVLV